MLPVLLSFEGKKIAIFGCGNVGKRRAKKILKSGGAVDIYSKEFDEEIKKLKESNKNLNLIEIDVNKLSDEELKNIIENYDFIITAINDEVNKRIVKLAKELNKFVNSSTKVEGVNFIIPAYTEVDEVIFSIYTKGKSPLMAKHIRIFVENYLKSSDIDIMACMREFLKETVPNQKDRERILKKIFEDKQFREELKRLIKKWEK
ncbi:precorrin-2 dehydrogenase/sirohydrochlorin ferrochelatase family protein [Methanocaldococcus fervens]|uniref:precorrin-2 dehydrogenase n=1 Tax=Methanocaldococcus fervens (strain DSM 4213 / JCM 15782 / AG86) TaxID=573064 RepID=C7P8B4_METFA|nr:bifunctional precorrin-2 dehydrogenase/sirohydrochlorin ferrochelatase [Methanocaldococcus fervens]ACV24796.1 siroheme synthase [Methanocaldococcus fervens AG86]